MGACATYRIGRWEAWHEAVDEAAGLFLVDAGTWPNLFVANSHTHSQIDFMASVVPAARAHVFRRDAATGELTPNLAPEVQIENFQGDGFFLHFAVDEDLADREFLLMDEPDWDGGGDDDSGDAEDDAPDGGPDGEASTLETLREIREVLARG